MYDCAAEPPPAGSPLETTFMLVKIQRQQAELLSTKATVMGLLALISKDAEGAKQAIESFKKYSDAMFPFLELATDLDRGKDMQRLLQHVKHPIAINVAEIAEQRRAQARARGTAKYAARQK